ncbi:hypothetical protein PVT67_07220 [Gallaecimonas kandeliae]|uniref:hypothetical protein n=1 Tax=Gallaecimonas kandeliae TaxID=3029055 RepID=UPI002648B506|nr:hypothetical protein [Gallaecimonas kandeliae]WKE67021.1 hypothetical protein PVT67_07220 [Gallaecimonas kandeliae]
MKTGLRKRLRSLDVHECRKVCKDCQAWAAVVRDKALAGEAKRLRQSLGKARDRHVQNQWRAQLGLEGLPELPPVVPDIQALDKVIGLTPEPSQDQLLSALLRDHARARRHYLAVRGLKHPQAAALHELRKEVKHLEALSRWLGAEAVADGFKDLAAKLGDDHDLSLLPGKAARRLRRRGHKAIRAGLKGCLGNKAFSKL